jgi:hypothetical protein
VSAAPRLELLVYPQGGSTPMPLGDFLAAGEAPFAPDAQWLTMAFGDGTREVWDRRRPVGDPARTARQLDAAADRLERGELALWRIAVDDVEGGQYLRFTPSGDGAVDADTFILMDDAAYLYPAGYDDAEAERLYAHVAAGAGEAPYGGGFTLPGLDRAALVAAMRREAARVRELLAAID